MHETQVELKPCPFCGKQPWSGWIGCNAPGMEDCGYWQIDCCIAAANADTEPEAAEQWNQRTGPATTPEPRS